MKNIEMSRQVLTELYRSGVREIAVCAGARNSPFVSLLEQCQNLKVYSFFEERSAAFFMLGCARRLKAPTAIITTSGTAVAELLPAVIEAYHSGVPLVVVSADRPRRLRDSGAPQSIDQTGLFKKFVEHEFDLENEPLRIRDWSQRSPLHVNICFDEPLLDQAIDAWNIAAGGETAAPLSEFTVEHLDLFARFVSSMRAPLIVVGALGSRAERSAVTALVKLWNAPVYVEGPSGLRGQTSGEICGGEASLAWALRDGNFDSVLRIGSIPTARIWRDLEDPRTRKPVLSLSDLRFTGLSQGALIQTDLAAFCVRVVNAGIKPPDSEDRRKKAERWMAVDREAAALLEQLVQKEPRAEPSLMRKLSELIPAHAEVYVGNSLPIREWDWLATRKKPVVVQANRGVNGIDGQLSTFLGLMAGDSDHTQSSNPISDGVAGREGWSIVGDLTAMYDLVAPWAQAFIAPNRIRLVIINNGGGKIFRRIFNSALFENRHQMGFSQWAQMWNLPYELWRDIPSSLPASLDGASSIIEVVPDETSTARFHDTYDQFWKNQK